jgi:hypothetical protein
MAASALTPAMLGDAADAGKKKRKGEYLSAEKGPPPVVISCFDLTGTMVQPWAEAGYECHIVDVQHPERKSTEEGNVTKWGMDVHEWEEFFFREHPEKAARCVFAAFFPPCTDLAVSGARWFAAKEERAPGTRARAMSLVHWADRVGRRLDCPYFIENPVSVISKEWRRPDHVFHPHQFGGYTGGASDGYTKKTCLWTGGGFKLPVQRPVPLDPDTAQRIWRMAPGPARQNERSKTPAGFARAVFETHDALVRRRIRSRGETIAVDKGDDVHVTNRVKHSHHR